MKKISKDNIKTLIFDFGNNTRIIPRPKETEFVSYAVRHSEFANEAVKQAISSSGRYEVQKEYKNERLTLSMPLNKMMIAKEGGKRTEFNDQIIIEVHYPKEMNIVYGTESV